MQRFGVRTSNVRSGVSLRVKAITTLLGVLLGVAPLVGMAAAGAAEAPKVDVLVRVEAGAENAVAAQVHALGGDTQKPLAILPGFLAKVPSDLLGQIAALPGVVGVVQGIDIGFDPALYDPEKISSSLYSVAKDIGADRSGRTATPARVLTSR